MKRLTIDLNQNWVLSHRMTGKLPTDAIAELLAANGCKPQAQSFTKVVVEFEEDKISVDQIRMLVVGQLTEKYKVSPQELETLLTFRLDTVEEKKVKREQPILKKTEEPVLPATPVKPVAQANDDQVGTLMEEIRGMLGARDFIALCERISKVAPLLGDKLGHIMMGRSYLFAIDDGYGLTSALKKLSALFELLQVGSRLRGDPVELKLAAESPNGPNPLEKMAQEAGAARNKLVCIDIREWVDKTAAPEFRDFLQALQKNQTSVFVFRTPYLEQEALKQIESAMADVLTMETVAFVPLTSEELTTIAANLLAAYGFQAGEAVWELFQQRMAEERSDGRFYGIKTVKKVVDEMVYRKLLETGADANEITVADLRGFVKADTSVSAAEMMAKLVGIEAIRSRIEEIVGQIEFARKNQGVNAPAMHMRFVGNPGTGKTTVARIVGQLLKERGILSKGYFFEHTGGDFIGMYVGHTAPKTLALCRDAYGSVLFIDEAYTLADANYSNGGGYAKEAVDTLIAQMENHRDDMVVIMAGYPKEMAQLMALNPGLAGRIPYELEFPNYSREDLFQIFLRMSQGDNFRMTQEAHDAAQRYFAQLPDQVILDSDFSNARFVRNLFERTWSKSVMRAQLDGSDPMTITAADFDTAAAEDVKVIGKKQNRKSRPGYKLGLV